MTLQNRLKCLFYLLMRDEIPVGGLRQIVMDLKNDLMKEPPTGDGTAPMVGHLDRVMKKVLYSDRELYMIAKRMANDFLEGADITEWAEEILKMFKKDREMSKKDV